MAHFPYIRAPGTWNSGSAFDPSEAELMGLYIFKALNADDGGSWAPSLVPITIGGLGLEVTGPLDATDVEVLDVTGGMTVKSGGSFTAESGSIVDFDTPAHFGGPVTVEAPFCLPQGSISGSPTLVSVAQFDNRYGTAIANSTVTLPLPTNAWQRLRVSRVRTADNFTITVRRADLTTMGVISALSAGWIEVVAVNGSTDSWVVSAWGGTVTSIFTT